MTARFREQSNASHDQISKSSQKLGPRGPWQFFAFREVNGSSEWSGRWASGRGGRPGSECEGAPGGQV